MGVDQGNPPLLEENSTATFSFIFIYSRAYKPANQYMDFFVSPIAAVTARFITFIAGSILGVLILLSGNICYNTSIYSC